MSKHDFWHLTPLTYKLNLAETKVNLHTEHQGRRSNSSGMRVFTDGRTLPSALSDGVVIASIKLSGDVHPSIKLSGDAHPAITYNLFFSRNRFFLSEVKVRRA